LNINDLDWFGWGDIIYFVASIMSVAQAFFVVGDLDDDDTNGSYYLISKKSFCFFSFSSFLINFLFPFLFSFYQNQNEKKKNTANLVFLVDSLVYLIGYLLFVYDIRYCLQTGKIPVARTATFR
jgi:hypothetical protein